jgi:membrane associated rhomboid family serine protease
MSNKLKITILLVFALLYLVLRYSGANTSLVAAVGGIIIGMLIAIIATWLSKLWKKRKKADSPQE